MIRHTPRPPLNNARHRLSAGRLALVLTAWLTFQPAAAAPHVPTSDTQVLETLPLRPTDGRAREMRALREKLAAKPGDAELAVALARRYFEQVAAEGDPRFIGHAQAVLAPWWGQADAPAPVRVMRAMLKQFNHQFDSAVADLTGVVEREPGHAEAWSWLAAIAMVQARYAEARLACTRMAPEVSALIATACLASVDSVTGRAAAASTAMATAQRQAPHATPAERLWVLTRLAENEERRGDHVAAERAFKQALALGLGDSYLQAAYADFLLDRGRANEVLVLLKDGQRSDLLLLRLALAAKALNTPTLAAWTKDLAARFDAARLRGDSAHEKEEARFALAIHGQADRALTLAKSNYAVQREPADARVLLEAALAARQPKAAEPVLQWLAANNTDSQVLRALARQIEAKP